MGVEFYECTISGLNNWYKKIFEKYGWIKLAWLMSHEKPEHNEQFNAKCKCYFNMLAAFLKAVDKKLMDKDGDVHYKDLEIMKRHVMLLKKHLEEKHAEVVKQSGGKRKTSRKAVAKKASKKASKKGSKKAAKKGSRK
jgi:hypothetical protein